MKVVIRFSAAQELEALPVLPRHSPGRCCLIGPTSSPRSPFANCPVDEQYMAHGGTVVECGPPALMAVVPNPFWADTRRTGMALAPRFGAR